MQEGQPGSTPSSWPKVLAVTTGVCAILAAGFLALGGSSSLTSSAEQPAELPAPRQDRAAGAAEPDREPRPKRTPRPYVGPPVLSTQVVDTLEGTCPTTFTVGVNVVVVKGELSEVKAELRIPVDKQTRTRTLWESEGEWNTVISGIPSMRTAKLVLMAKGPGGGVTEVHDVTHSCPGEPIDKIDPKQLGTKLAKQRIRDKMFDMDYDFEFDMSGKPQPEPKAGGR